MPPLPFKIKICGITTPEDAKMVVDAGADAIGLNFYPKGKRYITAQQAAQIAAVIPSGMAKVGVFVNSALEELTAILRQASLGMVQFHGDESPDSLAQFRGIHSQPMLRALRWSADDGQAIDQYLNRCCELNCLPNALLIDSAKPGQYGGTGETADWEAIARWKNNSRFDIPLILAGGLTPDNVAEAIRIVRPDAVDTASGVESSPGRKNPALVHAFVAAARKALES